MSKRQKRWTSAAARRILNLANNPPTIEEAVEIVAARLLDGVPCPPTNLEMLSSRLNVKSLESVAGLPISGELRKDGDAFKVVFSASLSAGRRRFTIAHELAHAIFETTGPNCPRYGRELERMCDMLAGEILLPRKIFSDHVGSVIQSASIYQLARDFDTSLMATSLRCCQLFGVSIFQVEKGRIAWGYGIIRNHRDVQLGGDVFEAAIIQSMEGAKGRVPVFIRGYEHILEWTPVPRQHRALFVLQPANRNNFQKMP